MTSSFSIAAAISNPAAAEAKGQSPAPGKKIEYPRPSAGPKPG